MKVLVLTISDRAFKGVYQDESGPAIEKALTFGLPDATVELQIVPDVKEEISKAFGSHLDKDVILTTGGTGLGPRDITPDVTEQFCDKLIPGISDYLRRESCAQTKNAVLSRGVAGIKGNTVIVNLPGAVKGAQFCTKLLIPILQHALKMIKGEGH
jgi:molybdopterin adenylyltransferase